MREPCVVPRRRSDSAGQNLLARSFSLSLSLSLSSSRGYKAVTRFRAHPLTNGSHPPTRPETHVLKLTRTRADHEQAQHTMENTPWTRDNPSVVTLFY